VPLQEWAVSPVHTCRGVVQGHAGSQQQPSGILEERAHHECHCAGGGSQTPTLHADAERGCRLTFPTGYPQPVAEVQTEIDLWTIAATCCSSREAASGIQSFNAECCLTCTPLLEFIRVFGCAKPSIAGEREPDFTLRICCSIFCLPLE
jgi:hypothetical protein